MTYSAFSKSLRISTTCKGFDIFWEINSILYEEKEVIEAFCSKSLLFWKAQAPDSNTYVLDISPPDLDKWSSL